MVFAKMTSIDGLSGFLNRKDFDWSPWSNSRGLVAVHQNVDWFERNTHIKSPTLFIKKLFSWIYWYFFSKGKNPSNGEKLR